MTILPLVLAGSRAPFGRPSSSGCGVTPASPRSGAGETPSPPSAVSGSEEGLGDALALAHGRNAVRFELFGEAMHAMIQLGGELANVNTWLEAEGRHLVHEWQQLKVAINLGKLQRDQADALVAASLATSREA